jgi:hypothetical protein
MISRRQFAPASKRQLRMIPSIASVQERGISRWGIPFTFRALRVTAPVGCALKRNLLIYAPRDRTLRRRRVAIFWCGRKIPKEGKIVLLLCDERVV